MAQPRKPVFIFDSTRFRSHLFHKYLSTSPDVDPMIHPFLMAAMFGPESYNRHFRHSDDREKEIQDFRTKYQITQVFADERLRLAENVSRAQEKGLVPVAKEHWFNVVQHELVVDMVRDRIDHASKLPRNPTHIPDDLFDDLAPVILIRHPVLAINSDYRDALKFTQQRPGDDDFTVICILKPLRLLFDLFKAQGRQPPVVDAEDLLWRTDDMAKGLCGALGNSIDAKGLSASWAPASEEQIAAMNPFVYMMTKNIQDSSGIERPEIKPDDPDIDKKTEEWTKLYGDTVANQLKKFVEDNMPHYEYLKGFKV